MKGLFDISDQLGEAPALVFSVYRQCFIEKGKAIDLNGIGELVEKGKITGVMEKDEVNESPLTSVDELLKSAGFTSQQDIAGDFFKSAQQVMETPQYLQSKVTWFIEKEEVKGIDPEAVKILANTVPTTFWVLNEAGKIEVKHKVTVKTPYGIFEATVLQVKIMDEVSRLTCAVHRGYEFTRLQ